MLGEASALGASAAWALTSVLVRSQATRLGAIVLSGWLFALASPVFLVLLLATGKHRELWQITLFLLVLLLIAAVIGRVLGDVLWVKSLQTAGVSRALPASVSSYPLFTIVLAVLFLDESASYLLLVGGMLAMGGIYLVSLPSRAAQKSDGPGRPTLVRLGVFLAVLAGLFWAVETAIIKRGLEDLHPITINFIELPVAAMALLLFARLRYRGLGLKQWGRSGAIAIPGAAIVGMVGGSLLFLYAISQAGAGKTAILASTSPLFALPLSVFVLKEPLTLKTVAGTLLCILGILLIVL